MSDFSIVFSPTAEEDLEEIYKWLSENAPEKTDEWLRAVERKIGTLQSNPERCPLAPENGLWKKDGEIRSLLFDDFRSKYRVLFSVSGQVVQILSIRHGARRYLFEE